MKLLQLFRRKGKEDPQDTPTNRMSSIFLDDYIHSGSVAASTYSERAAVEFPNQPQLPYELLLQIFSYVKHQRQLKRLCQCSKLFRSVAEVYLYRSFELEINPWKDYTTHRQFTLLETLKSPRYSTILKEMRVELGRCAVTGHAPTVCQCWEIDRMFGFALESAQVLQALSIKCRLCKGSYTPRHRYLMDLPTRSMREFCYDCNCVAGREIDSITFLLAPCMASITALDWVTPTVDWVTPTAAVEKTFLTLIQDDTFLANINTLQYYDNNICDELLAKRTIQRISSDGAIPVAALRRNPNKHLITHLCINSYNLSELLADLEIINFRSLQHVGTINIWSGYSDPNETAVGAAESL